MADRRLWEVWWLWGIPVAWATSALVVGAELARDGGQPGLGNLLDVARLAIYWAWMLPAWKCSRNVAFRALTPVARAALVIGLTVHAFA
jgi:hypothetical protein